LRSQWKCPYFDYRLLTNNKKIIKVQKRNLKIPDCYVNEHTLISTGRKYRNIIINPDMIGFNFGSFVLTKLIGYDIHLRGKRKKLKRQRKFL